MVLKTVYFVSLLCAALVMGLTVTHDLEIPAKQMLSGSEWLQVQHTFYGGFAIVGGIGEVLGLISAGVLSYLLRKQRTSFILALVAVLGFAGTLAMFAVGNQPINQQVAVWTPQTLPSNWRQARDAWDTFHAISSVLATLAFITLLITALGDSRYRRGARGG